MIYFKHETKNIQRNNTFKQLRSREISTQKSTRSLAVSGIFLSIVVFVSVGLFVYSTRNNERVNEINAQIKKTELEIVQLKSKINSTDSISSLQQRAMAIGLDKNTKVQVITVLPENLTLRQGGQ